MFKMIIDLKEVALIGSSQPSEAADAWVKPRKGSTFWNPLIKLLILKSSAHTPHISAFGEDFWPTVSWTSFLRLPWCLVHISNTILATLLWNVLLVHHSYPQNMAILKGRSFFPSVSPVWQVKPSVCGRCSVSIVKWMRKGLNEFNVAGKKRQNSAFFVKEWTSRLN